MPFRNLEQNTKAGPDPHRAQQHSSACFSAPTAKERAKLTPGSQAFWGRFASSKGTLTELLSWYGPRESAEGLISLLALSCYLRRDLPHQEKALRIGENNGKLYWHKSQELKWGKAGLKVYREKK